MAVLYAVLDLLLNFQHCWYNYVLKPQRMRKQQQLEAERQRAVTPGQTSDSTSNTADQQGDKLQHTISAEPDESHQTSSAALSSNNIAADVIADVQQPPLSSLSVSSIPAAHHLRALSAGKHLVQVF